MGIRRLILASALALIGSPASAQTAASNDRAYTLTVMCSVVASHYGADADILRTADAVRKMQRVMGYDTKRVADDSIKIASALGSELRNNPQLMEGHRAVCRQLKLLS